MAKNTHYYSKNNNNKKSEYRVNYLPFDYYDFWITAKENENLRFKNKLRDYLHTPFDWDENVEIYQESEAIVAAAADAAAAAEEKARLAAALAVAKINNNVDRLNQGTQTTARPNRHDHLKKIAKDNEQRLKLENANKQVQSNLEKSVQTNNRPNKKCGGKNLSRKSKSKERVNGNINGNSGSGGGKKTINVRPTKSAGVQVNFDYSRKKDQGSKTGGQIAANRCQSARNPIGRNQRNQSSFKLDHHCCDYDKEKTTNNAHLVRSLSNMSIQTPMEWNLRDYSRSSMRSAKSIGRVRSASMPRRAPERPPFANYGWAVKTKDLSQKPTHNSLANKVLAVKYHDENAINELKMQRMRKDATVIANEIVASDAKSTDRYRSDSRDWSSEYNEKYYDYYSNSDKKKQQRDSSLNRGPKINFYYY